MVTIEWSVDAPSSVDAGEDVKVTVNVKYSGYSASLKVKATVTLFGTTQSKTVLLPEPGITFPIELTFTAPSVDDRYTGKATLEAYY